MITLFIIFVSEASSWRAWRGHGRETVRFEGQSHWNELDTMAWLTQQVVGTEALRVVMLPLTRESRRLAEAVSHFGVNLGYGRQIKLLKVVRGDLGPADPTAIEGWESLELPSVGPLIDGASPLPAALDLLTAAEHSAAANDRSGPTDDGVTSQLKQLTAALVAAPTVSAPPAAPADDRLDKLSLPRPGRTIELFKPLVEREAAAAGFDLDWPAYLRHNAAKLYGSLPHPSWLPELEKHAPRASEDNPDNDLEDI